MDDEQIAILMDRMRMHHVIIPKYWTKEDVEKIAGKKIDRDDFADFRADLNYGDFVDEVQGVEAALNKWLNQRFDLGHDEDDEWYITVYDRDEYVETDEDEMETHTYSFKTITCALSFVPDHIELPSGVRWMEMMCEDTIPGIYSKCLGKEELEAIGSKLEEEIVELYKKMGERMAASIRK